MLEHGRTAGPEADPTYAWRVLSVTSLGVLLSGLNGSAIEVALPVVVRHFDADSSTASWLLLSYLLVSTVLILVAGRLADLVGLHRMYVGGLAVFTAASLAAGFAPTAGVLLALRVVQGVGAAMLMATNTALITDAFPARTLGVGLGLNVTVAGASLVLGPLVGGLLASTTGWRGVFWFNVPFGVLGFCWALVVLKRPARPARREPFDAAGAVLSLLLIGSLVLALSEGGSLGWTSAPVLVGAVVFVVTAPLFVVVQRRRAHPLVDVALFAQRERSIAFVAAFLLALARFGVVLLIALYVQAARGSNAFHAGLVVFPVALGMMVASPVAGRLALRVPARVLATVGLLVTGAGLLFLGMALDPGLSPVALAVALAAVGVGSGLFMTPNTSAIMATVPANRRGVANGLRSMLQSAGTVTGTALCLAVVTSPLHDAEKSAAYAGTLSRLPGGDLQAFTAGYHHALLLLAGATAVGAVLSLLRDRAPVRREVPAVTGP